MEITVPHLPTYKFGLGVDRLSGEAMNLAVKPTQTTSDNAGGKKWTFTLSKITSTEDLEKQLGIDVSASYGCACFGAGVSARFSFAEQSSVHKEALFMTITATVELADLSIGECILTDPAAQVTNNPEIFKGRYGDTFLRSCKRGGIFVGVLRIEAQSEKDAENIESDLQGSYGLFSAEASAKFNEVHTKYNASVYCTVYAEGGPPPNITDPNKPQQLLDYANTWLASFQSNPDASSVPWQWTLSPMIIAEGPLPPNQVDIQHAQDVLVFCATQRSSMFDQINLVNWWLAHKDKYDWSNTSLDKMAACSSNTEIDLDTIARCASAAMNDPTKATMPADFAISQGKSYPLSRPVPDGPKARADSPPLPAPQVEVPGDLVGQNVLLVVGRLLAIGLKVSVVHRYDDSHPGNDAGNAGNVLSPIFPTGRVDQGTTINLIRRALATQMPDDTFLKLSSDFNIFEGNSPSRD